MAGRADPVERALIRAPLRGAGCEKISSIIQLVE